MKYKPWKNGGKIRETGMAKQLTNDYCIMNNRLNIFLAIVFIALVIYSLFSFFIFNSNLQIINIIIFSLAINIVLNITIDLIFSKKKSHLLHDIGLNNIKLQQITGLEKVKTIIFSKQGIISQGKYKLINVEHRSTANEKSVIETAVQLAKLWESPYNKVLQEKLKEEPADKEFSIIQKFKEGITVIDENEKKFMLGTYYFV